MPIRAQETLLRWFFDETGGVRAMVQMAPPRYQTTVIPIEKSILFRTSIAKGNPEGVSAAPYRLPRLVLQEAAGGVRGDRRRA